MKYPLELIAKGQAEMPKELSQTEELKERGFLK